MYLLDIKVNGYVAKLSSKYLDVYPSPSTAIYLGQ